MDLLDREEWLCYLEFPPVIQRLFFFNPIQKFSESKKMTKLQKALDKISFYTANLKWINQ